jgi:hypothetical protein
MVLDSQCLTDSIVRHPDRLCQREVRQWPRLFGRPQERTYVARRQLRRWPGSTSANLIRWTCTASYAASTGLTTPTNDARRRESAPVTAKKEFFFSRQPRRGELKIGPGCLHFAARRIFQIRQFSHNDGVNLRERRACHSARGICGRTNGTSPGFMRART